MDESPSAALRRKRGASIRVAADAVARRSGGADVIVCDGFTGNVALKISEGLVEVIERLVGEQLSHRMADYAEYGGAPLLGVNGVAIVGHGRSSAKAVCNAIGLAHRFAVERVVQRMAADIASATVSHQ